MIYDLIEKFKLINLNMKLIVQTILFAVIVISSVQSFSQNSVQILHNTEMLYEASKYLILNNDKYIFNISESDAEKLGISKSYYANIMRDIEEVNNTILSQHGTFKYPEDTFKYPEDTFKYPEDTFKYPEDTFKYPEDTFKYLGGTF
jgi:hypothetical protein